MVLIMSAVEEDQLNELLSLALNEALWCIPSVKGAVQIDRVHLNAIQKETKAKILNLYIAKAEVMEALPKKHTFDLGEPELRQYNGNNSSPFYCSLCQMSEMNIMENIEQDKYYCYCSYWSDPHNAYIDKSGGKWLGWKDKSEAQKIQDDLPTFENGFNTAIDEIKGKLGLE